MSVSPRFPKTVAFKHFLLLSIKSMSVKAFVETWLLLILFESSSKVLINVASPFQSNVSMFSFTNL